MVIQLQNDNSRFENLVDVNSSNPEKLLLTVPYFLHVLYSMNNDSV